MKTFTIAVSTAIAAQCFFASATVYAQACGTTPKATTLKREEKEALFTLACKEKRFSGTASYLPFGLGIEYLNRDCKSAARDVEIATKLTEASLATPESLLVAECGYRACMIAAKSAPSSATDLVALSILEQVCGKSGGSSSQGTHAALVSRYQSVERADATDDPRRVTFTLRNPTGHPAPVTTLRFDRVPGVTAVTWSTSASSTMSDRILPSTKTSGGREFTEFELGSATVPTNGIMTLDVYVRSGPTSIQGTLAMTPSPATFVIQVVPKAKDKIPPGCVEAEWQAPTCNLYLMQPKDLDIVPSSEHSFQKLALGGEPKGYRVEARVDLCAPSKQRAQVKSLGGSARLVVDPALPAGSGIDLNLRREIPSPGCVRFITDQAPTLPGGSTVLIRVGPFTSSPTVTTLTSYNQFIKATPKK